MKKQKRIILLGGILAATSTYTDTSYAGLQQLIDEGTFNELERSSATAALTTYNRLLLQGCDDNSSIPAGTCTGSTFTLFSNVRELVHTANEITNSGATTFSLGVDAEGLGFALRWTAAEEYAAQGNLSSNFVGGQLSSLSTRLTALRLGASGFKITGLASSWNPSRDHYPFEQQETTSSLSRSTPEAYNAHYDDQLSSSLDAVRQSLFLAPEPDLQNNHTGLHKHSLSSGYSESLDDDYSRWGGFINFDFGYGNREATDLEDAFDFENSQIILGLDYRATREWIIGMVFGVSQQTVDFDGAQSIVEGEIEADGYSLLPFFMYQKEQWFLSSSIGWQTMTFDSERSIRYPSINPDVDSADTRAISSTDADMLSLFVETGYALQGKKWVIEPYVNLKYVDISIDGFTEDDVNNDAFDLVVEDQDIRSRETTLGTRFQYTFTPSFGILIPWYKVEVIRQSDDAPRIIESWYAQDTTQTTTFSVPTESLDNNYSTHTVGIYSVIRGGRQRQSGGPVVGGDLKGFISYQTFSGLEDFDVDSFSLGLRYTF